MRVTHIRNNSIEVGSICIAMVPYSDFSGFKKRSILIIDKSKYSDYLYFPLTSNKSRDGVLIESELDIADGILPVNSIAITDRVCSIAGQLIEGRIATLKNNKLAIVLREFTKASARLYFKSQQMFSEQKTQTSKTKYIPASGKIIDEKDLDNMIDSSLDMWLTAGRFNDEFEKKLSEFLNVKYALTVNSGSSANLIALTALTSPKLNEKRLKKGDEVITVAAGFPTTIAPIIQNGLIPVFIDIQLGTYNIDPSQIEESITSKTKAIFIAHTLGNPFDVEKVLKIADKHNLWLIEDNCDALGSKVKERYTGTFGHISTLSFYPAHHITMGEGGAVMTNDPELYSIALSLRDWGRDCWCKPGKDDTCKNRFNRQFGNLPTGYDHKYVYSHLGYNLKITDWQASIGVSQLDKLPVFIEKRKENFGIMLKGLKKIKGIENYLILPEHLPDSEPSWFGFPVTVKQNQTFNKIDLVKFLESNSIGTRHLFAGNILRQPAFLNSEIELRIRNSDILKSTNLYKSDYEMLPNTDTAMNSTFWIGVWPTITEEDINFTLGKFKKFLTLLKR
jgi:CDP-6-deoxy-D-xylo-4-hexulose-3-dehydrase